MPTTAKLTTTSTSVPTTAKPSTLNSTTSKPSSIALFPTSSPIPHHPTNLAAAAIKAVLREDTTIVAVGGISIENIGAFKAAGVNGFALGSSIYKPGMSVEEVGQSAKKLSELLLRSSVDADGEKGLQ
jgi:hypothetical protein